MFSLQTGFEGIRIEQNLCGDLLKDTNSALSWLNSVNKPIHASERKQMRAFKDFRHYEN